MNVEIKYTALLAICFLVLFGIAELIYYVFKPKAEYTRKLVHFGTGLLTLSFPIFLNSIYSVLFLCTSFIVILSMSLKFNFLKSINSIDRKSYGSISYPIAVFLSFVFYKNCQTSLVNLEQAYIYFYLPILILAICDPLAALIGKPFPLKKIKVGNGFKSIMGLISFFISCFLVCLCLFYIFNFQFTFKLIFVSIGISIISSLTELYSPNGLDNVSIPLSVGLVIYFSIPYILC